MNDAQKDVLWGEIETILKPPDQLREDDITITEYAERYGVDHETARTYMMDIAKKSDEWEYTEAIDPSVGRRIRVLRKATKQRIGLYSTYRYKLIAHKHTIFDNSGYFYGK